MAFKRLYAHYGPFVWRIALRSAAGDADEARIIMQDVFVRAYRSLKTFSFASGLSTWLYRITFNELNSYYAKRARDNQRTAPLFEMQDGQAQNPETRATLESILAVLSPEDRFLLVAREADGLTFEEIGAIAGKKPGALRTKLHRIKDMLRKEFRDE